MANVILDNTEIELLKGLANGRNLREINSAIRIYSRYATFYSVAESLL